MLPKSLEQVNAPTSEAGGIETLFRLKVILAGYKSGVCPCCHFPNKTNASKKLCPVTNYII